MIHNLREFSIQEEESAFEDFLRAVYADHSGKILAARERRRKAQELLREHSWSEHAR